MNRRTLLQTLAALPLCGWMRPKRIGTVRFGMQVDGERFAKGVREAHRRSIELLEAIAAKVEREA